MNGFVDETTIVVSSGSGGDGAVSFRREKYVPRGGPDGGDGGKGGNVVFTVRSNLKTLSHLKLKRVFKAENGKRGAGQRMYGKDGEDVEIPVPPGTILRDKESGELLADLTGADERFVLLRGGRGGKGNSHYATSINQAPRYAQKGVEGESREVKVELHLIADVGFVGLPNAGKSTLLSLLTNAHPLIADYPFTTKVPNLGLLRLAERDLILADIPGHHRRGFAGPRPWAAIPEARGEMLRAPFPCRPGQPGLSEGGDNAGEGAEPVFGRARNPSPHPGRDQGRSRWGGRGPCSPSRSVPE